MPKGVITVAVFYGALATLFLIIVLTGLLGLPPVEILAYICAIFFLSAMIVTALSKHSTAWWVFIVLQLIWALFDAVMGVVKLLQRDYANGFFCLTRVCIYGVIIWYFMWPEIKEFYGVKQKSEQPSG